MNCVVNRCVPLPEFCAGSELCRSGRVQPPEGGYGMLQQTVPDAELNACLFTELDAFLDPLSLALFDEVKFVVVDGKNKAVIFEFVHDLLLER